MHNKLQSLRLKHGYSGSHMAAYLNISKVYYHQLETGQRRLSYEMAFKMAKIFKLKPDDIFYNDYLEKN